MTSALRLRMLSTTSAAIVAGTLFGMAQGAAAQTVCTTIAPTTTTNIECNDGTTQVATGTTEPTTIVAPTAQGLDVSSAADLTLDLAPGSGGNTISTNLGSTSALAVQAVGTATVTASGVNFTTTNDNSDAVTLGGANVSATLGNLSTSGANANALIVTSPGDIDVTIGDASTAGSDADVVVITGGAGSVAFTGGNLTSTGLAADALRIDAVGPATATVGDVSTAGDQSIGVLVGSQTSVSLTTGSVTTTGATNSTGVIAQSVGATTVDIGGPISTAGTNSGGLLAFGSEVDATFGDVTTAGAGSIGVSLAGTTGGVTVNQGAGTTVTTTGAGSDGVVISGIGINGTLGNVSATGAGSRGVVLTTSGAPIDLVIGDVTSAGTGVSANTSGSPTSVTLTTGTITTTEDAAAAAVITAPGPVTFTSGALTTAGLASDGLTVLGGADPVDVTVAGAQTAGADSQGVDITSTGAVTVSNTGTISTSGAGSQGILIRPGATTVAATCGNISTTGANSPAFQASAAGDTTVTCGTVTTTGANSSGIVVTNSVGTTTVTGGTTTVSGADSLGIDVATTGTGAVLVNTGAVSQTGANTAAVPSFAAVRVIAAGAAPVSVVANGNVSSTNGSGIWAQSADTASVTINSGSTVQGGIAGVQVAGVAGNTLTVNGTLQGTGTGQAFIVVGGGSTVTIGSTGVVNGTGTLTAGDDTLVNNGTFNSAGTLDFGAGTDSFTNAASGTLNLTAATTLTNLEAFANAGRLNLNTFTLTGPAIAFNNTGTIDTSGSAALAGFTSFSNAGTVDLAAGTFTVPAAVFTNTGTILADEGASTITGQTGFANSGTIDLQDGAVGDILTINSDFVGSGASSLLIDVTGGAADRLVITGAASGSTSVNPTYFGPGQLALDGLLVVDTGTSTANAFVLGSVTNANPLVDYSLVQQGADYFLVAAPNASIVDPLALGTAARTFWYQSADEVIARTRLPVQTVGASFWGQVYASKDKVRDNGNQSFDGLVINGRNRLDTKRLGIQAGVDYGFGGGLIGLTAGFGRAKSDTNSDFDLKAKGWNVGLYGQFGGPTGFHGELLAKHDRFDIDVDGGLFDGLDTEARSNGVDGAIGYRFGMNESTTLDANVGVSHVRTKIDDIDAFGFSYDLDTVKSTRGRAGLRATFAGDLAPYIDGTVYREFNGDTRVALFDGADTYGLSTNSKETWFRLEGGIAGRANGLMLAAWADLGDRKGFGARAGFRFGGAAEAAPLPPPPPPPPAPPAPPPPTQTCADGSVILATDSCPLPPPPPPPPPAAPERG